MFKYNFWEKENFVFTMITLWFFDKMASGLQAAKVQQQPSTAWLTGAPLKHTHIKNNQHIINKSEQLPLGKSCGLTNSRKNSCAMVAFSVSEVEEANQKWRVRLSWVCLPVCADTRNTRNSSESCAGLLSASIKKVKSTFSFIPYHTVQLIYGKCTVKYSSLNHYPWDSPSLHTKICHYTMLTLEFWWRVKEGIKNNKKKNQITL